MSMTGNRKSVYRLDDETQGKVQSAESLAALAIAYALLDVADAIRAGKEQK